MALTVKEMLQRPDFESASIITGRKSLNRSVNWVHIIEIENFGHLLNGGEVILTTGGGWVNDDERCLSYLQQLIDYQAAALCIELVYHRNVLPEIMLEVAEEHDFPIIAFSKEVRFIDITRDLHEQILGVEEGIWIELDVFYRTLNRELTTDGTVGDFLRILHQKTNRQVALTYYDEYRFFPSPSAQKQIEWKQILDHKTTEYYSQPIYLLNDEIGRLYFLEPLERITRFGELALKRCSEIFNQFFWSHHHQKEIQQLEQNKWLLDAVRQPVSHEEISRKIHQQMPGVLVQDAVIGVKPERKTLIIQDKKHNNETKFIMAFRAVLRRNGLELFTVKDRVNQIYILLIMNQQSDSIIPRMKEVLRIFQQENENLIDGDMLPELISFGRAFTNYEEIDKSYHAAMSTLHYQQKNETLASPFYEELGVYRIIDQFKDKEELAGLIDDYLQPLIKYDEEKGTELLKTLEVYLARLGQKNETAQELHIVRQTLYHRLNKIEQMLGKDYMLPENRFMIEFAIHASEFLKR